MANSRIRTGNSSLQCQLCLARCALGRQGSQWERCQVAKCLMVLDGFGHFWYWSHPCWGSSWIISNELYGKKIKEIHLNRGFWELHLIRAPHIHAVHTPWDTGALHALAERLETQPGSSEHIAALRNNINWQLGKLGSILVDIVKEPRIRMLADACRC